MIDAHLNRFSSAICLSAILFKPLAHQVIHLNLQSSNPFLIQISPDGKLPDCLQNIQTQSFWVRRLAFQLRYLLLEMVDRAGKVDEYGLNLPIENQIEYSFACKEAYPTRQALIPADCSALLNMGLVILVVASWPYVTV